MTKAEFQVIVGLKITIEPVKKCWFIREDWSNYTTIKGERAHRFAYRTCVGPLIAGQEICHKCDRRGCINPEHLFQGTHSANMKDMRSKRRGLLLANGGRYPKNYKELDRQKTLQLPPEYYYANRASYIRRLRKRIKEFNSSKER